MPSLSPRSFRPLPGHATRAQFSPVLRRAMHDTFVRRSASTQPDRPGFDGRPLVDDTLNEFARVTSDRWWDPHLIDRLRSPLTRYRD